MNEDNSDDMKRIVNKLLSNLPVDAIQVFVRGFHDRETGNRIMEALDNLGFHVKEAFDGGSDDLGGIIETEIATIDQLETGDLQEIKDTLYKTANDLGVFCQWSQYYKFDDSMMKGI